MLALLMVISTFTPQLAFAAVEKPKSFSEAELALEKQREKAFETGEERLESEEKTRTESEELTNLLMASGLSHRL